MLSTSVVTKNVDISSLCLDTGYMISSTLCWTRTPSHSLTEMAECTTEGEVRLIGSSSRTEGRVEICRWGLWTTVCADDSWTNDVSETICIQLGYKGMYICIQHLCAYIAHVGLKVSVSPWLSCTYRDLHTNVCLCYIVDCWTLAGRVSILERDQHTM